MPEFIKSHMERRGAEEGLDFSGFEKSDLNYREGREKLHFNFQFSSGELFEATEENGQARFVITKDGQEVFDFKSLLPQDFKFRTPEYWLNLKQNNPEAPAGFKVNPEKFKDEAAGVWQCGEKFISVGRITSIKDVLALLHEVGHSKTRSFGSRFTEQSSNDQQSAKLESANERLAWAEALKIIRKVNKDLGVDLTEGFSDQQEMKDYIYTCLASHRYMAELKSAGTFRQMLAYLDVKPVNTNLKWLDKLFDKRKLTKKVDKQVGQE